MVQNEASAIDFAAEQVFKLTQQEIEALEQDVVGTVPKLLAKAYVRSQQSLLAQLERIVPVMMHRYTTGVKRNTENEGKFYARWPDIKADQHGGLVAQYAAVFRQMHPRATAEDMIEKLGPMVMLSAGIVPSLGTQPAAPAAPANPMHAPSGAAPNGRPPAASPFVPAGAGPVTDSRAVEMSPIEALFAHQD